MSNDEKFNGMVLLVAKRNDASAKAELALIKYGYDSREYDTSSAIEHIANSAVRDWRNLCNKG